MSAYAADNDSCFFGGWESVQLNGSCKFPERYTPCENDKQFRCSKILFGGHCIDTGGVFTRLTDKCYQRAQNDMAGIIEKNSKINPQEIAIMEDKISRFCKRNSNYQACHALAEQVTTIQQGLEIAEVSSEQIQESIAQNRALGILDTCQKHYEMKNNGFIARMFSSDRDIIAGIKDNYALCDQILNNVADRSIDDLEATLNDIEDNVNGKEILAFINKISLKGTLQALFITHREYGGAIQEREVLEHFCNRSRSSRRRRGCRLNPELSAMVRREIDVFKSIQFPPPSENISRTVQTMKSFGEQMNRECRNFRDEYRDDPAAKRLPGRNRRRYTDYAKNLWANQQEAMQKMIDDSDPLFKRFFATEHFRDEIVPFDGEVAKKCAEGNITEVFNTNLKSR